MSELVSGDARTAPKPVIAAFDFDGTLTKSDTLLPFLRFVSGNVRFGRGLGVLLPIVMQYLAGHVANDRVKEAFLTTFLKGRRIDEIHALGEAFAAHRLATSLRAGSLDLLAQHKQQRHSVVLVSASLDVYLRPWARAMGVDHVLSSSLEIDAQGRVTGALHGPNCYGPEKVRRLRALLGVRDAYILYAYGDSKGDWEMMDEADHAYYRGRAWRAVPTRAR
jgi:HAD superfamily hydrolase (TIGR01490 family)